MSAQDLHTGMKAIDDEAVRQRVASGDIAAAGKLDLTDEESRLLRGAADDYPDVAGFAAVDYFMKISGVDGESQDDQYNQAVEYLKIKFWP